MSPSELVSRVGSVAVVGSGAVGTYYGARLALAGSPVTLLMRGDLEAVRARGSVLLHDKAGTTELRPVRTAGSPAEVGPVDLVVVTLKTTANGDFPRLIGPLLGPATTILTLQNGLGSDEQLAREFGAGRIVGGLAFIAATRSGPGEVTCYHPGSISLGEFGRPPSARTADLAALFEGAGVRVRVVESLAEARWRKLVWNIPFNGLTIAAGAVPTDRLCADPGLAAEVRALMEEVRLAAAGCGHAVPPEFLKQQFEVTAPMGPYRPSSLVDYQAGRAVEVEAIWGEPLRRASAAGVQTPRLALLYALLGALTAVPRGAGTAASGKA